MCLIQIIASGGDGAIGGHFNTILTSRERLGVWRVIDLWEELMKLPHRQFLRLTAGAAALPVVSRIARAQAYVRIV
jgi:hypothetical protein